MSEKFTDLEPDDLDAVGSLYVRVKETLVAIATGVAREIIEDHEDPPERMVKWVISMLAGVSNPAVELDPLNVAGRACRRTCEHLRLALAACTDDIADILSFDNDRAEELLERYARAIADNYPPEKGFSAWLVKEFELAAAE